MDIAIPTSVPLEGSLSPLHLAAATSSSAVAHMLSVMRKDVGRDLLVELVNAKPRNDRDYNGGYTALHYACQTGLPRAVQLLLEAGANPNAKKNNGATPLICSISSAGWNHGADNTTDVFVDRLIAAEKHVETQKECIRMLLNHPKFDLSLNDQDGDGRCSPSWMCVGQDFQYKDILSDILDILLARGFDANGTIHDRPALHMALLRGHVLCAHKLVKAGADIYTMAPRTVPGNDDDDDNDEPWTALQACRSVYGEKASLRMEETALAASAVAGKKTRLKILRNTNKKSSSSVKKLAQKSIKTAEQLMQVGRWGSAAAAYEEALGYGAAVIPKVQRYKALNNVSACLIQACRSSEAINYSRQLVAEFPDNPMCHITLAITLDQHRLKTGCEPNWDDIAESCAQAESLFDGSHGNEWWMEVVSIEQGQELLKRVQQGIPDKGLFDNPACQAAKIALDNFNGRDGNIVKAAQAIDRALDPKLNHPNPLTMRMVRGSIYYQLGSNMLQVASNRIPTGRSIANVENVLPSLQKLVLEDPWTQAKESFETALEEYDHCLHANDGRFRNGIPAWNSGLALVCLCRFDEGSTKCLEGLQYNLENQLDTFGKAQKCGSVMNLAAAGNSSNKDFILQLELAFENVRMSIETRKKEATNECIKNMVTSATCEVAAAKLREDCAATIVETILQAHRRLKSAVSTRVVGTILKEALDWDANCEIPEELRKAQRKVVPELRCAVCGVGGPMQSCPCKEVHYCRKECQVKAWKEHKRVCKFQKKRSTKKA